MPFVQRIQEYDGTSNSVSPHRIVQDPDTGEYHAQTHLLAVTEAEGQYYVYPTLVQDPPGSQHLEEYEPIVDEDTGELIDDTAWRIAKERMDYVAFDTFEEAMYFSKEYKQEMAEPNVNSMTFVGETFSGINPERMVKQTMENEGWRQATYRDSLGKATIGYGFHLARGDAREKLEKLGLDPVEVMRGRQDITRRQGMELLRADLKAAGVAAANIFPGFKDFPGEKKEVIIDLIYNLGTTKFGGFKGLIKALNKAKPDWKRAALELKYSDPDIANPVNTPYWTQVGNRAKRNYAVMVDGV